MNVFPHLIKKDLEGRVWWKLQRSYKIPSVYAGIKLDSPNSYKSVRE